MEAILVLRSGICTPCDFNHVSRQRGALGAQVPSALPSRASLDCSCKNEGLVVAVPYNETDSDYLGSVFDRKRSLDLADAYRAAIVD